MNVFQIDYLERTIALLKESFAVKKYKAMHPALAVLVFIFMLPFFLSAFALSVSLILSTFVFQVMKMPIDFLHALVHSEGQDVKHATQVVIYWLSWPFLFFAYALLSFSLISITCSYALLSICSYIWTLGGFKFHVFIPTEAPDYALEVNGVYSATLPLIFIAVCGLLSVLQLVFLFVAFPFALFLGVVYNVFAILFTAIAFAKYPQPTENDAPQQNEL